MFKVKFLKSKILPLVCLIIFITSLVFAYEISWWSIDGGGNTLIGGSYTLIGIIGQPDAGVLTGGQYTLTGGFLQRETGATFADIWYLY